MRLSFAASIVSYVCLALSATQAFAWGEMGHRVIGLLAERHTCASAKKTALDLLDQQEFAEAATWADSVRTDPNYAAYKPWHFVDMPLGSKYSTPNAHGDLVTALAAQTDRMMHGSSKAARAEALKLVLHFVGDAHQPLHCGDHNDYGGNAVDVTWFGFGTNLHHVWDTEMLYEMHLTVEQIVDAIESDHASTTAGKFDQLTPVDWVNESSAQAKTLYPSSSNLGSAYYNQWVGVMKQRLWLAGMRLAAVLNQNLGCTNLDGAKTAH